MQFPVLLEGTPAPHLLAYTIETVIAEKFRTMIFLGAINSRMKDFYDVYHLLTAQEIDEEILRYTIITTLQNRGTDLSLEHSLFSAAFRNDPARTKMWETFLKKIKSSDATSFQQVMDVIIQKLPANPFAYNSGFPKYCQSF